MMFGYVTFIESRVGVPDNYWNGKVLGSIYHYDAKYTSEQCVEFQRDNLFPGEVAWVVELEGSFFNMTANGNAWKVCKEPQE